MIERKREKFNGYWEPEWKAEENERTIRCIITNLFATSQIGNTSCPFCGAEYPTKPTKMEDAATSAMHGRGCVWAEALRLFGVKVNQK
jgi:hypothetical protein